DDLRDPTSSDRRRHGASTGSQDPVEERTLAWIPYVPATENLLERSVTHRFAQYGVHRIAQRGIGACEDPDVVAHRDGLRENHEAPSRAAAPAQGALRDDVVEQHRIDTSRDEVAVRMHVVVVGDGNDARGIA